MDNRQEKNQIRWMKKSLLILGGLFVLIGMVRQWPVIGGTYLEFIEGKGYLTLMLGLIMIVLGFSVRLLMGEQDESQ